MLTIRPLRGLATIGLLAACLVPLRLSAQRPAAQRSYDEAGVRLVLLDITLGQDYAYYRGRIDQPDVREAIRRWDAGVRVRNADHFERVRARRGRGVGRYTFRDRKRDAEGMDVMLSTDPERERPMVAPSGYHEAQVRLILLDITLGQSYAYYRGHIEQPDVREAIRRWDTGVRVVNGDRFETRRGPNGWHRTYRGSNRDADGMDVVLTTDAGRERGPMVRPDYDDAQVRLILLDLALGQTEAYYRSHMDQPDAREALHRWDAGVRVRNIDRFERKRLTFLGAWHRVYRGTNRDVDGRDVMLTSDVEPERRVEPPPPAYAEAMVRLILLDIALANDYVYYRARLDQPDVREALRRWDAGVRVRNANQFERRTRAPGDVHRRWRGTNREAGGMDVILTTDPQRRP
jgi:hypothetical protein